MITPWYGTRGDGSAKGNGYFGPLPYTGAPVDPRYSSPVSTELTMDDYPLLVPTLTKEEVKHLLSGGKPTPGIMEKAMKHKRSRQILGLSPYAQEGEQSPPPWMELPQ